MACLSPAFWEYWIIAAIVLIAIIAIIRLVIVAIAGGSPGAAMWPPVTTPWATPPVSGFLGIIAAALNILIWAIVVIIVVKFLFALIACLFAVGGFRFP